MRKPTVPAVRRKVLWWVLVLALIAAITEVFAGNSGYVGLRYGEWLLETRPLPLLCVILLFTALLVWATSRWQSLRNLPLSLRQQSRRRRQLNAIKALLENDAEQAKKLLGDLDDCAEVDTLLAALGAWQRDALDEVDSTLQHLTKLQPKWKKGIGNLRARLIPQPLAGEDFDH